MPADSVAGLRFKLFSFGGPFLIVGHVSSIEEHYPAISILQFWPASKLTQQNPISQLQLDHYSCSNKHIHRCNKMAPNTFCKSVSTFFPQILDWKTRLSSASCRYPSRIIAFFWTTYRDVIYLPFPFITNGELLPSRDVVGDLTTSHLFWADVFRSACMCVCGVRVYASSGSF